MNWKYSLNAVFVNFGNLAIRRPLMCLLVSCFFLVGLAYSATQLKQDMSSESFFEPDSPVFLKFQDFRKTFGRDEFFLIMVETENMYRPDFLQAFSDFHH